MERRMDRGWSKEEEKWIYGIYCECHIDAAAIFNDDPSYILSEDEEGNMKTTRVMRDSFGMTTDEFIKKRELFEGDIVKVQLWRSNKVEEETIGIIRYGAYEDNQRKYKGFFIEYQDEDWEWWLDSCSLRTLIEICSETLDCFGDGWKMSLIGNTTENPELLV